jgi:hypothetical protein
MATCGIPTPHLRRHCYTWRVLTVSTPFLRPSIRAAGYTVQILLLESGLKKPCQLLRKHEWLLHWAWHPASLEASPVLSTSSMKRSLGFVSGRYSLRHASGPRHKKAEDSMELLSIISPTRICETRVVEDLGTNDSLQSLVSSFVLLALGSISVTRTDETELIGMVARGTYNQKHIKALDVVLLCRWTTPTSAGPASNSSASYQTLDASPIHNEVLCFDWHRWHACPGFRHSPVSVYT